MTGPHPPGGDPPVADPPARAAGTLKVAVVQHDIVWEDAPATLELLTPQVAEAVATGARLVVLTEMFSTGFSMAAERVAEAPEGPTMTWMSSTARRRGVWLAGSVALRPDPGGPAVNRLVVVDPRGRVAAHYDKRHPYNPGGEGRHYRAGDRLVTVDIEGVAVTPLICYDLRFPEDFRAVVERTDCYLVVASWPAARQHHWETLTAARAIENQAWMIAANRVGTGGGTDHAGGSRILDPAGGAVVAAGDRPAVVTATVDRAAVAGLRSRFPVLADRR